MNYLYVYKLIKENFTRNIHNNNNKHHLFYMITLIEERNKKTMKHPNSC